jgi:hypothetical protein
MKRLLFSTALLLGMAHLAGPAKATLTLENPGTISYQQTLNSPCVIGDPSCNNPGGFSFTTLPGGNVAQYDAVSPVYTVGQITTLLGSSTFSIGIDVNTTTTPATELLKLFTISVNGVVVDTYSGAGNGTQLQTVHNGNGYSDELIDGFNLTGLAASDTVQFHTIVNDPTDGREEFFLINVASPPPVCNPTLPVGTPGACPGEVPEPASLAVLGSGMAALAIFRRRRRS